MMPRITQSLTNWLIQSGIIPEEDRELYEYAATLFILDMVPLLLALCIGCILGMIKESIVLMLPFMAIRKFSGGFHLKSRTLCLLFSSGILFFVIYLASEMKYSQLLTIIVTGSAISLILLSPIDSMERRLTLKEKNFFKFVSICIVFICIVIYALLLWIHAYKYAVCIGLGLILSASLQIPCLILGLAKH